MMITMTDGAQHLEQIRRARKLLKTVRHASYATVNEDGTPHNSPLMLIYNDDLTKLYIGTFTEALHTKNLVRTGATFVVLYDSFRSGQGGVYITGVNAHECKGDELVEALRVHNATRERYGYPPLDLSYYQKPAPAQRMYSIDIVKIEVYGSLKDEAGLIISEARVPVDQVRHLLSMNTRGQRC
jgi:hypothetical protein